MGSSRQHLRLLELGRLLADDALVGCTRAGEIGLGLLDVRAGTRQPRLGLRHVGTRDLADLEPIAGSLQLALQTLLVVERQIEHRLVPEDGGVGIDAVQQYLLLQPVEACALRLHLVLGLAHLRLGAAAGVEVLAEGEVDALAGTVLLEHLTLPDGAPLGGQVAIDEHARPITRQGLRHVSHRPAAAGSGPASRRGLVR